MLQGRNQAFVTLVIPNGLPELAGRGRSVRSWGCSGDAVTAVAWILDSRIRKNKALCAVLSEEGSVCLPLPREHPVASGGEGGGV